MMASSCDRLDSALNYLTEQLERKQFMLLYHQHSRTRKLLARARRLIKLNSGEVEDKTLYNSLSQCIYQLENDWQFLRTFLICIPYWTDADKVVQNLSFLITKIEAAAAEIAKDISAACEMEYVTKRPSKMIEILRNSLEKIQVLKPEIGEVHHQYCLLGKEFVLQSSSLPDSLLKKFVFSLKSHIKAILDRVDRHLQGQLKGFEERLDYFELFFVRVEKGFADALLPRSIIDNFLSYVANVSIRLANQSCFYWFGQLNRNEERSAIIGLLEMQQEIDPTTPEFLEVILELLRAINRISSSQAMDKVDAFLKYLLKGVGPFDVAEQLKFLLAFVINEPEESTEDVQSCLTDTKAVIREAGFAIGAFHRLRGYPGFAPYLEGLAKVRLLKGKIWLLKVEISLKGQLNGSTILLKDQIKDLNDGMKNLQSFSEGLPEEKTEQGKQTLKIIETAARELASLSSSCHVQEISGDKVRKSLFVLLLKVLLFKANSFFEGILDDSSRLMDLEKDRIEALHEGLKLLIKFIDSQREENADYVEYNYKQIETVARKIIFLYYSCLTNKITEEMMDLWLSDLLAKIKLAKVGLGEIYPLVQKSNVPEINGLGCIDFILINLKNLQNYRPDSIEKVKHQILEIQENLEFLRNLLGSTVEKNTQHQELKDLGKSVTEVAYRVEYIIDSIEGGIGDHWQHLLWLDEILEDIRHIKVQAGRSYQEKVYDGELHKINKISSHRIPQAISREMDEVLIGLNDQEEVIIDRLLGGSSQQDVVSIVGMPGIGKTTLAKKVYNDARVTYHFHTRAWCCVSQVYSKRELLHEILSNISGLTDNIHQMTDEDLDLELYQQLKRRRYLIVMDDLWSNGAWDDLERSFPNDRNGSRILITSRIHDVALKAKPNNDPHPLRLLTDDESWRLLQLKLFHKEGCPEELFEVGKKIAENCKGLPLGVIAVAGLLERMEKKQDLWEQIVESLSSRIIDDPQTRCNDILQLSYNHLPENLKACFLYFGAFLEDKDIPVCKLIWLWIAEGFVRQTENKSLEDLGEDYLKDLIGRSLVMVSKRRSIGGVKACRVHDLLRDLCLLKSKEENFLQPITRYDEPYATFDGLGNSLDFDHHYPLESVTYERHRLCICLERRHFIKSMPSGPGTRSLLFFAATDSYPRRPYEITFICQNFKLLRVLDLQSINMGMLFPTGIELLVQLRYLAISGGIDFVPSLIANLWKLETFLVKGLKDKVALPNTVWSMTRLRHVHVKSYVVFNMEDENLGHSTQLNNLLTFSSPTLSCGENTEKILRRLPNLQKLKCIFVESWDSSMNCNQFPRLDILTHLDSLNVLYSGRTLSPGEFNFPENLKKLTLTNFRLPWSHISTIGRLQNLEVLKLHSRAFEGRRWDMKEGEFLKLKFLKLDNLNLVHWNADSDHLPNLHQLVLRRCKDLEEVPSSFDEIPTLQMIEVQECGQSLEESVKKIEEGIEGLKVLINHSDIYFRSSI
ncbi:hypothetical protein ACH5RR_021344 [Cinchona calisaya]|uniref:Uncharacterized protein n=1 Tax=Cinchona calisaya TaxID=153742 RepID=A0ABD2ZK99_9GENT